MLAGVLVAEAALAAAPAFLLLFVRDVLHSLLDQVAAGLSGADAAGGLAGAPSPDTGRITLWGLFFLIVTVAAAVSSVAVRDRQAWSYVTAGVVQVGLLVWALAHLGSWSSVATVALILAVTSGSLLALPDVRRWCLSGD